MTRHKWLHLMRFQEWPQGNRNKWNLELKMNCTKNNQDDADQITTTDSEMTVRAVCSVLHVAPALHSPLKLPFKSPCPMIGKGELVLWSISPPSPQDCRHLSSYSTLISQYWILELRAKPEFDSTMNGVLQWKAMPSLLLKQRKVTTWNSFFS